MVHAQQQPHQSFTAQQQQQPDATYLSPGDGAVVREAAAAAVSGARLPGSAVGGCSQDSHNSGAASASTSTGPVAAVGEEAHVTAAESASTYAVAAAAADADAAVAADGGAAVAGDADSAVAGVADTVVAADAVAAGAADAAAVDADADAAGAADADAAAAATTAPIGSSSSSSDLEQPPKVEFYNFYHQVDEQPVPVQLPPPGTTNEPPEQRPVLNKSRYKSPSFLQHFGAPKGAPYNFMSFLGPAEWHGGKYLVSPAVLDEFLQPYYYTFVQAKRRLHIAQCYQGQPYK